MIDTVNVSAYIEGYSKRKEMIERAQHGETRIDPESVTDYVGLNPYPVQSEAHEFWMHGWKDAWNPEAIIF